MHTYYQQLKSRVQKTRIVSPAQSISGPRVPVERWSVVRFPPALRKAFQRLNNGIDGEATIRNDPSKARKPCLNSALFLLIKTAFNYVQPNTDAMQSAGRFVEHQLHSGLPIAR